MYSHYRKSVGALVVYDVTKRSSFENVIRWLKELKANAEPDINVVIVGNKIDACEEDPTARKVTTEEGQKLAVELKAMFEETSAVKDINVKSTFENLMQSTHAFFNLIEIYDNTVGNGTSSFNKKGSIGEKLDATATEKKSSCSC